MERRKTIAVTILVLAACALMAWIEAVPQPSYPVKSALRIALFTGAVGLYSLIFRDSAPFAAFRPPARHSLLPAAGLAVGVFAVIVGGYALLAPWLDLSAITGSVEAQEGITAAVYPFVAVYVTLGNSLLEELFFRGLAFLTLRETGAFAWIFSALAFACYHVSIVDGWFPPALFVLLTAALAVGGSLFNWLDREGSLWPAWLVHAAADAALNVIGFRLFGIL